MENLTAQRKDLDSKVINDGVLYLIETKESHGRYESRYTKVVLNDTTKEYEEYVYMKHHDAFPSMSVDIDTLPSTQEMKDAYKVFKKEQEEKRLKNAVEKRKIDIAEKLAILNSEMKPNKMGQKVTVVSGKHKGFEGVIFYTSIDKFKSTIKQNNFYASAIKDLIDYSNTVVKNDLKEVVGVKNAEGKAVFVKVSITVVSEGFIPYEMPSDEDILNKIKVENQYLKSLFA